MVADFFSADFSWLRSKDGKRSARRYFCAGKGREGYFTNDNVLQQAEDRIIIACEEWPEYDHVFVFNNTSTHCKHATDALSAQKMTKNPSANFGSCIPVLDEATGKPKANGETTQIRMADGTLPNEEPQPLYFPADHPEASLQGLFKGMVVILEERGFKNMSRLRPECKGFKCLPPPAGTPPDEFYTQNPCCLRCLLYHQPDFTVVKSILEMHCEELGATCIFLLKFHCELNPIEQCWGYAKHEYQKYPASTKESDLEANVCQAMESVPLKSMRW